MEKSSSTLAMAATVVAFMGTILLLTPLPAAATAAPDDVAQYYNFTIENRMGEPMQFKCADRHMPTLTVRPAEHVRRYYRTTEKSTSRMSCEWSYAGNTMTEVPLWDETWPEAASCVVPPPGRGCRVVFENKVMTVVSATGGRRVLGDVAVKECSKNWFGWLPFSLGCYPEHDHPYVGKVVS